MLTRWTVIAVTSKEVCFGAYLAPLPYGSTKKKKKKKKKKQKKKKKKKNKRSILKSVCGKEKTEYNKKKKTLKYKAKKFLLKLKNKLGIK